LKQQGLLHDNMLTTLFQRAETLQEWIGQVAVDDGIISDLELANALAKELRIPLLRVKDEDPDESALVALPRETCRNCGLLPIRVDGDTVLIACANPLDDELLATLPALTGYKTRISIAPLNELKAKIEACYASRKDSGISTANNGSPFDDTGDNMHNPDDGSYGIALDDMLYKLVENKASDLHLTAASQPIMRVHGELVRMPYPELKPQHIMDIIYAIITDDQMTEFERHHELDFAYSMPGLSRFRVNVYRQRGSVGSVFRVIPTDIPTLDKLKMPEVVRELTGRPRGLVLVTGPTGSGKSTTLAAMINEINSTRAVHIMTLEDPIEFLHVHKMGEVNQREIGSDTDSFTIGLKHVLRQDPDVILIGEMRDLETVAAAVTAAETGHLVFATLHTTSASQTIDRIIDVFPPHQQEQVRSQLAIVLEGILTQTLLPNIDGKGRSCAQEILIATPAVRNLIREGKAHQIASVMQASAKYGMQTLDQALLTLIKAKKVSLEEALLKASNIEDFRSLMSMQS
ncbi:MAG: PilT/PilU family type 4a pilus ATPase, partial [bacterium]